MASLLAFSNQEDFHHAVAGSILPDDIIRHFLIDLIMIAMVMYSDVMEL